MFSPPPRRSWRPIVDSPPRLLRLRLTVLLVAANSADEDAEVALASVMDAPATPRFRVFCGTNLDSPPLPSATAPRVRPDVGPMESM